MTDDTASSSDSTATVAWRTFLDEATARLSKAGVERPETEARWIVEEASGADGDLHLVLSDPATVRGVASFDAMLARREAGEPLQYVLGHWPFRSLDLLVDRRVLIPRPETEGLVDRVLAEVDRLVTARDHDRDHRMLVADLGTGSGAIGLAVAAERSAVDVVLTDRSTEALAVARANLAGLGRDAGRVVVRDGRWFEALAPTDKASFGVIASNPPYVADGDPLPDEVRFWEPAGALFAGEDGTSDLIHLVAHAAEWLVPAGALVLELDPRQVDHVIDLGDREGFDGEAHQDLAGRDRVVVLRLRASG